MPILLQADHREIRSGIPHLLLRENTRFRVIFAALPAGDYLINNDIGIERKSAVDFIQSVISCRLFAQLSRLKKFTARPLLIIEGNPYRTTHKISEAAIRNAILSVTVAWQVPVIFSKDKGYTANLLGVIAGLQSKVMLSARAPQSYRPKKITGKKIFLLQAIPGVGPTLSFRLLQKFRTIKAVINADEQELSAIEGVGIRKARLIYTFINK